VDELRFDGRVVIVTGAGRGVGREHALLLAARGARVAVVDVGADLRGEGSSSEPADAVVDEIRTAGGEALACHESVTDHDGAAAIVERTLAAYGRVDALVNNAGVYVVGTIDHATIDDFRSMMDVNLFGSVLMAKAVWPHLVAAGHGRIVNTSSEAVLGGLSDNTAYGVAKAAVFGLTRCLATDGHALGIRVNALAPRAATRMFTQREDDTGQPASEGLKQMLSPAFCAPIAAYLAHEACDVTGQLIVAGMQQVNAIGLVRSRGLAGPAFAIEDIAGCIDTILDMSDASVTSATGMQV
jgi:NAD(P)-dependent dehydrogenase (short-subunit alcohol dehydrogenase family)